MRLPTDALQMSTAPGVLPGIHFLADAGLSIESVSDDPAVASMKGACNEGRPVQLPSNSLENLRSYPVSDMVSRRKRWQPRKSAIDMQPN